MCIYQKFWLYTQTQSGLHIFSFSTLYTGCRSSFFIIWVICSTSWVQMLKFANLELFSVVYKLFIAYTKLAAATWDGLNVRNSEWRNVFTQISLAFYGIAPSAVYSCASSMSKRRRKRSRKGKGVMYCSSKLSWTSKSFSSFLKSYSSMLMSYSSFKRPFISANFGLKGWLSFAASSRQVTARSTRHGTFTWWTARLMRNLSARLTAKKSVSLL